VCIGASAGRIAAALLAEADKWGDNRIGAIISPRWAQVTVRIGSSMLCTRMLPP
jgi:hypothetical protein